MEQTSLGFTESSYAKACIPKTECGKAGPSMSIGGLASMNIKYECGTQAAVIIIMVVLFLGIAFAIGMCCWCSRKKRQQSTFMSQA